MNDSPLQSVPYYWASIESKAKNLFYGVNQFTDCEQEPLVSCGAIQSFGLLLVVDSKTLSIQAASGNWPTAGLAGFTQDLLGKNMEEFLVISDFARKKNAPNVLQSILEEKGCLRVRDAAEIDFICTNFYSSGANTVFEFEK